MKKTVFLLILAGLFFTCMRNPGTNDETISGAKGTVVYEPDGKTPAVGAVIKIFSATDTSGQYVAIQSTDTAGRFSLTGLPSGIYNIWIAKDSLVAFQGSVIIASGDTTVKNDTLECSSSLTGIVGVQPQHDPRTVTIQVVGSDKHFNNTDINGRFTMSGLARGDYQLILRSTLPDYTPTAYPVSVNACSNDTLADTLWLIYTGIPVVTGLSASYDTLNGRVLLHWRKTTYRDFQDYVIYKDFYDSVNLSTNPFAAHNDTLFTDTIFRRALSSGPFSFADTNDYHYKYRVAVRNNLNKIGETYRYIDIVAASPAKVAVHFQVTTVQIAKGLHIDTASINDTMLFIANINNQKRNLKTVQWIDLSSSVTISRRDVDTGVKTVVDSVKYHWASLGSKGIECMVTDEAGTIWKDTVMVAIIQDPPVINLTAQDTNYAFNDTIKLHLAESDRFGRIVKTEWDVGNTGVFTENDVTDTAVLAPSQDYSNYQIVVKVTDDDGNVVMDSVGMSVHFFCRVTGAAAFDPVYQHSSVVFDNKMWVIGGLSHSGNLPQEGIWNSVDGTTWVKILGVSNYALSSVVFDSKIWAIAGMYTSTMTNQIDYSSDGINWAGIQPASFPYHAYFTSLVFNNNIWVIAGFSSNGNGIWNTPDGINWTQTTPSAAFCPRSSHTSLVYNNKMWVIGGDSANNVKNDVWYSSDGSTWTQATASAAFSPRAYHTSVVYDNKMWVIGGDTTTTTTVHSVNDVWYSSDGATWTLASASPGFSPRYGHTSLVYNNKIWVIGGNTGTGSLNDVWRTGEFSH